MNFRVHMDPKWVHMEAEGRPHGGLGAKPPEKGPLGPIGPYWALLALLALSRCLKFWLGPTAFAIMIRWPSMRSVEAANLTPVSISMVMLLFFYLAFG